MRVRALTPEQREAVANLTHPSQMPIEERRRQYNALNRRLESAKDLPPGLIEKWNAQDSIGKFLICLSCFNLPPCLCDFDSWSRHSSAKQFVRLVCQFITQGLNSSRPSFLTHQCNPWRLKPSTESWNPSLSRIYSNSSWWYMLQLEAVTSAGRSQVHRASPWWTRDQVWCWLGQRQNLVLSGPQC